MIYILIIFGSKSFVWRKFCHFAKVNFEKEKKTLHHHHHHQHCFFSVKMCFLSPFLCPCTPPLSLSLSLSLVRFISPLYRQMPRLRVSGSRSRAEEGLVFLFFSNLKPDSRAWLCLTLKKTVWVECANSCSLMDMIVFSFSFPFGLIKKK